MDSDNPLPPEVPRVLDNRSLRMLKGSYRSFTTDDRTHYHKAHFDKVFNAVPYAKFHCSSDFWRHQSRQILVSQNSRALRDYLSEMDQGSSTSPLSPPARLTLPLVNPRNCHHFRVTLSGSHRNPFPLWNRRIPPSLGRHAIDQR